MAAGFCRREHAGKRSRRADTRLGNGTDVGSVRLATPGTGRAAEIQVVTQRQPMRKTSPVSSKHTRKWVLIGFWGMAGAMFLGLMLGGVRGTFVPMMGTILAALLTRDSVPPALQPFFPAYCVGTGMAIWGLWSMAASGATGLLVDLALFLVGLGGISLAPGLISTLLLTVLFSAYSAWIWSQRLELSPDERQVATVEVALLLTTVAGAWVGYWQWRKLADRSKKKPSPVASTSMDG